MKKVFAGIAIFILCLSVPASAAETISPAEPTMSTASTVDEVAIGFALTVTAAETTTSSDLGVTVTPSSNFAVGSYHTRG